MISIVIPNYNGFELLQKNIPSVLEACKYYSRKTNNPTELIIVDDASTDDSKKYLKSLVSSKRNKTQLSIRTLYHKKNKGFSEAMNTGIDSCKYPIIVSLNSDVNVTPEFLLPLSKHFSDPNVFSVKCHSILPDGTVESIKKVTLHRGLVQTETDPKSVSQSFPLIYSDAGSCAYDRTKLNSLGNFDTLYSPFYFEDCDLGYRALKRGWINLYEPNSIVYHEHNQSVKKVVKKMDSNPYFIRNRELFNIKNIFEPTIRKRARKFYWARLAKAVIKLDRPMIYGLLMAIIYTPKAIINHKKDIKYEVLSDGEVLSQWLELK
jgi:GT2 family glycosyltransferase